jgi:hypothetical protein
LWFQHPEPREFKKRTSRLDIYGVRWWINS